MFARIRKNSGTQRRSVMVCHNIRQGARIRQIVIKIFGHSDDETQLQCWLIQAKQWIIEGKQVVAAKQKIYLKQMTVNERISIFDMEERARINVGVKDIFGKLYDEMGFQDLLSSQHQRTLQQVLFARLLEPGSKRRLSDIVEKKLDEELPVDRIYRMMDALIKESNVVQQKIFAATQSALNGHISLLLFDVTTLSFESITEDELRAFGFSKDFKFNTTQITLALATTAEGLPIGFRLFPGNTAETKTLIVSINSWREQIPIGEVTIVGDRAMMSDANLAEMETAGFQYVVSFPLRKLSQTQKEFILDKSNYKQCEGDEITRYLVTNIGARNLCVSYSPKRASKDQKDRARLVNKLKKKLESCKNVKRLINNKGYLKFSEISGQATAAVDEEKIAEDAKWDGLHAVITNVKNCDLEIYKLYRRLWVIEESFRINKHNLKMRPIYHFTPKRIQAHILLCYMVFTMIRHVQFRLQQNMGQSMSVTRIIDAIRDTQASILEDTLTGKSYRMLSRLSEDGETLYKTFNIRRGLTVFPC